MAQVAAAPPVDDTPGTPLDFGPPGKKGLSKEWWNGLERPDKTRLVLGPIFFIIAVALVVYLLAADVDPTWRWMVYLPISAAVVTPGQVMFC